MPGVIVPRKAIGELSKLLAEESGDVKVALSTYKIQFTFGDLVYAGAEHQVHIRFHLAQGSAEVLGEPGEGFAGWLSIRTVIH